jgi:hypothetical protein
MPSPDGLFPAMFAAPHRTEPLATSSKPSDNNTSRKEMCHVYKLPDCHREELWAMRTIDQTLPEYQDCQEAKGSRLPRQLAVGIALFLMVGLLGPANVAVACPPHQSRGALGWCYPEIGGVVGQTTEALKHGDINTFAKGIGDIALTFGCPPCAIVGQVALSKQDRALISTVAGRGLILYSVGVPPVFIVADAANTVSAARLAPPPQPVIAPQSPAPQRGHKTYKVITQAACLVAGDDGRISAGWVSAPTLVDVSNGIPSTFPDVDLVEGDIISVTAEPCTESDVKGNAAATSGTFTYSYANTIPGPATRMKFFLSGKKLS